MKKLKKAPKKLKSVNEIPKFSDKHGFDLFKATPHKVHKLEIKHD